MCDVNTLDGLHKITFCYSPVKTVPLSEPGSIMYNGVDNMSKSTSQVGQGPSKAGRYMWIILPLVTGVALVRAFVGQGFPVLYPFIQDEFGLSLAQVGLITSAVAFCFMATAILAGWLTDTMG